MASPLDPPAQPSVLPSPPTSPTSPRIATIRARVKASRRPVSIANVPSPSTEDHAERTRSTSPSLSRIVTDPDALGSEFRTTSPASANMVASKRRQSSIAYYTPSSPAPWNQRPQSSKTLSSGPDRDVEPVLANGKENVSKRSSLVLSSRSTSARESVSSFEVAGAREREPLTLVEKHADLLHFIAQKERKCLELRDQLAVHEKELAELKRKWECIVNRGHDTLPNSPPVVGIGGAALDGLKEGVRLIAAGFSDFSGVIHELDSSDNDSRPKLVHIPDETNNTLTARAMQADSEHRLMTSVSSIQESVHALDHVLNGGEDGTTTTATAPSLTRAGSLNARMHRRASRILAEEPTTPTYASVSLDSPPVQSPKSTNLDLGMSLVLAPSPTLVPPLSGAVSAASATSASKSLVNGSENGSTHSARPVSSWMDNMGKKLSELQRGQTFSKSQKRASLLLAGVSSTISAALSPGPTATTPAPLPKLIPATTVMAPRTLSATSPVSTKSLATRSSPPSHPHSHSGIDSLSYPSYRSMSDWLDDDEEQTVHPGGVLVPDTKAPPHHTVDGRSEAAAAAVSSFDDDWNW